MSSMNKTEKVAVVTSVVLGVALVGGVVFEAWKKDKNGGGATPTPTPTPSQPGTLATDVATPGPYTQLSGLSLMPGHIYLVSGQLPPGTTLQGLLTLLTQNSAITILQSWNVGQVPASWPEKNANEVRLVVQYSGGVPVNFSAQFPTGWTMWTTQGATA